MPRPTAARRSLPEKATRKPDHKPRARQQTGMQRAALALREPGSAPQHGPRPADVLQLQRLAGNRAVAAALGVQARLTVGPANDHYEQEADRVARQVLSMPAAGEKSAGAPAVQREAAPEEEEVQAKRIRPGLPAITPIQRGAVQREAAPEEEEIQAKRIQRESAPEEEELQMKPVQRQEEEEELQASRASKGDSFATGEQFEDRLNAARAGGQPLPEPLRTELEPRFGADFSDVRVHTGADSAGLNRQIQAKAFTHGSDIFFGEGAYDPNSQPGKELLAHELTHTIQQGAASQNAPQSGGTVQRMMNVASFKEETTLFGEKTFGRGRNQVTAVDTALTNYLAEKNVTSANIGAKKTKLDALIAACDTYLQGAKAKRKSGVRKLLQQAQADKRVVYPLEESTNLPDTFDVFKKVVEAQDAVVQMKDSGEMGINDSPVDVDRWMSGTATAVRNDPTALKKAMDSELDQLEQIRQNPATHPLTAKILGEVLANAKNVHYVEDLPGARFKKDSETFTEKYLIKHNLNAPMGTSERLGSLTHELTHVSVSETWSNTVLFLMFDKNATDKDIIDLSSKRSQQLAELEALMESDTKLTEQQKQLVRQKVQYPYKGQKSELKRYLSPFKDQIPKPTFDRMNQLADQGVNNSVTEFDTVINQMMMYMQQWGIPDTNPFYKKLIGVAQEAYDRREAARG